MTSALKTLTFTLAATVTWLAASTAVAAPIPEDCKIGGFAIGCQAYTFNRFSVMEAIEKTALTGSKVIEFYPGQKLSSDQPDVKWDHNASAEVIAQVKAQLAKHGVRAVNYGVVGAKDVAEWRAIFEFARKLGLYAVTTEGVTQLDIIEPLVKEFDISLAIHNHPRQADNPNYKVWDPAYVL
ncbi:MAG: sugar phosphate isomerase/epimerase, partial [Verrucomicrobia subdivision 3 bacterium]|nr:sugar phosphate isomerase/epimerase [Limisphaerales bacterium]